MKIETDIFNIKYNDIKPKKGRVLISEPYGADLYFSRSVVLLTEHNDDGTVGFILNKPLRRYVSQISNEFGKFKAHVYIGGPVNRDNIYYIHSLGDKIPESIQIAENLFWGGNFKALRKLIDHNEILPSQIRFFIGYSGWEKNQLDKEIKNDSWLVSDIDHDIILKSDYKIWKKLVYNLGNKYRAWTNFPENPTFN